MTNPAEFIKHNGLVKISGPKRAVQIRMAGEIDVLDHPVENKESFVFREKMPY